MTRSPPLNPFESVLSSELYFRNAAWLYKQTSIKTNDALGIRAQHHKAPAQKYMYMYMNLVYDLFSVTTAIFEIMFTGHVFLSITSKPVVPMHQLKHCSDFLVSYSCVHLITICMPPALTKLHILY